MTESSHNANDSTLLAIVHGDIDREMQGQLHHLAPTGESVVLPPLYLFERLFERRDRYQKHLQISCPPVILQNTERHVRESETVLREAVGDTVFSQIHECRRMVFLINSLGGKMVSGKTLGRLARMVQLNSGKVEGYIGNYAHSTAADILADMDVRVALPESKLMWHRRSFKNDDATAEEIAEDIASIDEFFEKNVRHHQELVRERLRLAFEDPLNKDKEVSFTGSEMEKFGVVQTVKTIDDLEATVTAALPAIPLATETLQESIARFFRFNRAEKSVRETYGKDIYLHTETPKITCEYYEGISPEKNREILSFLAEKLRKPSEPTHE